MRLDAYTDDAICNAMGLGQFEHVGGERAIRLLLKPSFHPEACVTVEPARLHVVALRSMLWREPVPCRLLEYAETASLVADQFDRLIGAFDLALAEDANRGELVCLDGMPISALRIDGDRRWKFGGHPTGSGQSQFVVNLLRLAHASVSSVHLRNRIAEYGRYLSQAFKIEPEPELPNTAGVLVLGAPDDRADYFKELQRKTAAADGPQTKDM